MTDNVTEILMPMRDLIDAHGSLQVFDAAWLMSKSEDEDAILTRMKEILLKEIPICDLVRELEGRDTGDCIEIDAADTCEISYDRHPLETGFGHSFRKNLRYDGPIKILVVVD